MIASSKPVKFEGGRELDAALGQLPKATGRNVLKRTLKHAIQPIADAARANAPKQTLHLVESLDEGFRLNKRQSRANRNSKSFQEIHFGATNDPAARHQEFGTVNHPAQPYLRPAWEANRQEAFNRIGPSLWEEIEKAAARAARKTARLK